MSSKNKYLLGIDEAGRGPIIGAIVMAGCVTTPEIDEELKALGVKDSKQILPNKRNFLFDKVKELVLSWEIIVETPQEIDHALNHPDLNLNKLEALTSAKIINAIKKKCDKNFNVMLDSPTNTPAPYVSFVHANVEHKDIDISAETKADVNHPSVSAASILAKVTRDRLIEELEKKACAILGKDVEIGSGYPSDPKTKTFVSKYYDKLDSVEGGFFRKTWATYKNVLKEKAQKGLGDF